MMGASPSASRLLVVRHGDRHDYANPDWAVATAKAGGDVRDPPLSELGHRQARETAAALAALAKAQGFKIDCVLASPYLRTIQTAAPLAQLLGLPVLLEEGLAETHHRPDTLPGAAERHASFPEVDVSWRALHPITPDAEIRGVPVEGHPNSYFSRILNVSSLLERRFAGKCCVLFTHAASVSLVSALTREPMPADLSLTFAPCGVYHLKRPGKGGAWRVLSSGNTNAPHVSENNPATGAWGFSWPASQFWNSKLRERASSNL